MSSCPVSAAHRRLIDAHELWHQLGEAYMSPAAFRRLLNTLIPELRNISWLIQKQKNSLPHFSDWYPSWQTSAKDDRVMKWIINSRNRVVKEGDLDLLSVATITHQSLDYDRRSIEAKVPPGTTTDQMASQILKTGRPDDGLLTIRRIWSDVALPGYELMNALGHAWLSCARLVSLAHEGGAGATCFSSSDWDRKCVTSSFVVADRSCLMNARQYYELSLDLASMETRGERLITIERTEKLAEESRKRFGSGPSWSPGDAIDTLPTILQVGRAILTRDESLVATAHYFKGDRLLDFTGFELVDRISTLSQASLVLERASELEADSVAVSAEIWFADFDIRRPGIRAADRPDRFEALTVQAVRSDGTARLVILPFTRETDGTKVFESPSAASVVLPALDGLREFWRLRRWWVIVGEEATRDCE